MGRGAPVMKGSVMKKCLAIALVLVTGCEDPVSLGGQCVNSVECVTDLCVNELQPNEIATNQGIGPLRFQVGMCTESCEADWPEDPRGTCPAGARCVNYLGGPGVCFLECSNNADCGNDTMYCSPITDSCLPK